ncbi:MAG: efflux RND transporter periplasmic adaptor subunit [Alphaproteobacteria bacterium]
MTMIRQQKPSVRRPVKIFAVLMLLLALGFGGYRYYTGRADTKAQARITIETVKKGDIEEVVTAQGKLEPKEYVDVGVQVSGQIKKIYPGLGDTVKAGDLIAEIDPRVYEAKVEADNAHIKTLEAQLAQQQAQVRLAQQQFDRVKKLLDSRAVSEEAFDNADTALKVAKAQKDALDAQIDEQKSNLEGDKANLSYTKIFAPINGTVVIADTKVGQTLNATQSAPRVVQLANLDTMTVRAQVAEADVMRVKPGGSVYFRTLGAQDRKWTGTVRQVLPTPEVINEVVLYNVLVDVDNKDRQLMTGMSTQMFFVMGRATGVPLVPVAALGRHLAKQDDESGAAYVVHLPEGSGKGAQKIIRVGLMNRSVAEVKEGLQEGDRVSVEVPDSSPGGADSTRMPRAMRGMPRL